MRTREASATLLCIFSLIVGIIRLNWYTPVRHKNYRWAPCPSPLSESFHLGPQISWSWWFSWSLCLSWSWLFYWFWWSSFSWYFSLSWSFSWSWCFSWSSCFSWYILLLILMLLFNPAVYFSDEIQPVRRTIFCFLNTKNSSSLSNKEFSSKNGKLLCENFSTFMTK